MNVSVKRVKNKRPTVKEFIELKSAFNEASAQALKASKSLRNEAYYHELTTKQLVDTVAQLDELNETVFRYKVFALILIALGIVIGAAYV
jgi:hypothetical protein